MGSEPIEISAGPVIVSRARQAWVVEGAEADLFVTQLDHDSLAGAPRHLLRVAPGAIICGLDLDPSATGLALVARGGHGAVLRSLDWASLARTDALRVERWVADLSAAVALGVPPRRASPLEAGVERALDAGARVTAADGVLWVEVRAGRCAYQGNPDLVDLAADEARTVFPVSSAAWLLASTAAVLVPRRVDELPPAVVQGALSAFHHAAARSLVRRLQDEQEAERRRLSAKSARDRQAFSRALHVLADSIEGREAPPSSDPGGDPMQRALEIVGAALRVPIRRPARMDAASHYDGGLRALADASGLRVRQVQLAGDWWKTYSGPLLAQARDDRRPVALVRGRSGGYQMHDVGQGTVRPVDAAGAASLGTRASSFYRSFPNRPLTALDVVRFGMLDCRRDLLTVLLMGAGAGLLAMLVPMVTGVVFDEVIPAAMRSRLWAVCGALLVAAVASGAFQVVRAIALIRLETRMNVSVQAAVWDRLIRAPVPFFRQYNAGDLAMRAMGIDAIRQIVTGSAVSTLLSGTFSLFSVALLFYYSWRLALPALGMILAACAVTLGLGYRQVRYQRELTAVQGKIAGLVLQIVAGIAKIRISGAERRAFANWGRAFGTQKQLSTAARRTGNHLAVFNAAYPLLCTALMFFLVFQAEGAGLSTGRFLAFSAAYGQLLASMLGVCATAMAVAGVVPYYERARPILTTLPEVSDGQRDPGDLTGAVDASHIRFRYRPEGPLILDDVSIRAGAGEFVALVGASGCGKSTLLRVLLGFERPEAGAVYYDGQKLSDLDVHLLRRQIGVVLQNARLVSGDIVTNIIGAAPNLTVDDAWEAARRAGIDEDIARMPMGMSTLLSEGGGGLSGGQRQRLLVARAIVTRPRVLLFDEATSALDNQTQAVVSRSIEQLRATRIVIAHRATTVRRADRIYVFDRGRVVESGRFDELLQAGGAFARLVQRQLA